MVATPESIELAIHAARAASFRKAENIVAFDVSDRLPLTDIFVIASASSERQVGSIVDEVEKRLLDVGVTSRSVEGKTVGRWVLMDFGDIVVHVQHNEDRAFYALEKLWKDGPVVNLPADVNEIVNSSELPIESSVGAGIAEEIS